MVRNDLIQNEKDTMTGVTALEPNSDYEPILGQYFNGRGFVLAVLFNFREAADW